MNWPALFLGCFVVGFALSALSLALSPLRLHVHLHLPVRPPRRDGSSRARRDRRARAASRRSTSPR